MKRSAHVRLLLLGGIAAGAVAARASEGREPRITADSVYTNDYFIAGAGYYHAPFRRFFPHPYNFYDSGRRLYFYGGNWGPQPHRSIINISSPSEQAIAAAQAASGYVRRSGFGGTSRGHRVWS